MMNGYGYGNFGYFNHPSFGFFLIPLMAWSLVWKGWALWKASKNDSLPWFIALLVINTMGILEILYIFVFSKQKVTSKKKKK